MESFEKPVVKCPSFSFFLVGKIFEFFSPGIFSLGTRTVANVLQMSRADSFANKRFSPLSSGQNQKIPSYPCAPCRKTSGDKKNRMENFLIEIELFYSNQRLQKYNFQNFSQIGWFVVLGVFRHGEYESEGIFWSLLQENGPLATVLVPLIEKWLEDKISLM
jgi:hypothetical protein